MRVAINVLGLPSFRHGGAGTYSLMLIQGLARHPAVEPRVICDRAVEEELAGIADGIEVHAVPRGPRPIARKLRELAASFRDPRRYSDGYAAEGAVDGCDLVHYPLSFVAPPVHDLPTVITSLDLQHRRFPAFFSRRDRLLRRLRWDRALGLADEVIAISDFTKRSLHQLEMVDPGRIEVVPLACDGRFFEASGSGSREDFFFYPASPLPAKNHGRLLEAFARVAGRHPALRLVLSGSPMHDWSEVEAAVAGHRAGARVEIRHDMEFEDLLDHYTRARALVFPSLYEGFGLPVAEAMASHCLVLASTAASVPEVAGTAAISFDPEDVGAIEQAMERALALPQQERAALVEEGRARAEEFRPERLVAATIEVYERATRVGSGTRFPGRRAGAPGRAAS